MPLDIAKRIAKSIVDSPDLFFLTPVVTKEGVNLWYHSTLKGKIGQDLTVSWIGQPIHDADQRLVAILRRVKKFAEK